MNRTIPDQHVFNTAAGWFKASYSGGQNGCVETTFAVPGWIGVRDSKLGDNSPVLAVSTTAWTAFRAALTSE